MATEKKAYAMLKAAYPGAFWQRMENSVGAGTPDVFYCYEGKAGWIECKVGHYRKRTKMIDVPKPKLRAAQYAWMTGYVQAGGTALICLYVERERFLCLVPFSTAIWERLPEGITTAELDGYRVIL